MNKTILITGATSGIGEACARKFADNGDKLILTGRNAVKLAAISDELKAKGTEVITLEFDVRNRKQAKASLDSLPEAWQQIDVLVNNAGLALGLEAEYEGNLDDWETMIDTNIKGLLTMTRLVVPGMVSRKSGCIVNISSMWGQTGASFESVYSASKGGVDAFTKSLAKELGPSGIRVNAVSPGCILTDMCAGYSEADLKALADETCLGRNGTPQDIANAVAFLASDKASFITGQILGVNGGMVI